MCGAEPDRIGNTIEAIKKIKPSEIDEKLKSQLLHVMKKLEEVIKARPKPEDSDSDCPCGQCGDLGKSIPLLTI